MTLAQNLYTVNFFCKINALIHSHWNSKEGSEFQGDMSHWNSNTPWEIWVGLEFQGGPGNPMGYWFSNTPWDFQGESLFPAREAVHCVLSRARVEFRWVVGGWGGLYSHIHIKPNISWGCLGVVLSWGWGFDNFLWILNTFGYNFFWCNLFGIQVIFG